MGPRRANGRHKLPKIVSERPLVASIAAYFLAIVGLCTRSPNCPRLNKLRV
jgi:hypothetical protein